ncbi:MAG: endopeptidase La [Chloroflexi bacterium]|nr:endopeptidase La [Chloroflexota bacterium]
MTEKEWYPFTDSIYGEDLQRRTEELESIPDAIADEYGLITCPVLPLRDVIILPHMLSPLYIGREETLSAIEEAQTENRTMIALAQRDPDMEQIDPDNFLPVGVELAVGPLISMPNITNATLVQGRRRLEVEEVFQGEDFLYARARPVEETFERAAGLDALMRNVLRLFERFVGLAPNVPDEAYGYVAGLDDYTWIADMIASAFSISLEEQHALLTNLDPVKRLEHVHKLLAWEVEVLQVDHKIHEQVRKVTEHGQRENYLREQLKVIQEELGDTDPWMRELGELNSRLEAAKLPEEPNKVALKELNRLTHMAPMSPEVGVIRTFIEWILDLPWTEKTDDNLDVAHASLVLDEEHYGLPKAKDRILEYIAVLNLQPKRSRQPILCFVGAPGTGKTSLGKSIAKALGRNFARLSLGGVRDEAEIRGHRRTYIGALPGRILQTMRRAGSINPLFFLDEVDKLGSDMRGDPAAALLEVLDPEQNNTFSDHYLEMPYDLSKVMFITTANTRRGIPWALLDRMEVVEFPGYIEEEKIEIARRFQIKRQLEESGLGEDEVLFTEQALKRIIREYTYEAGVRNLEREIGRVSRKIARKKAEGKRFPTRVSAKAVEKFLGPAQFIQTEAERQDEVGVATALAWTGGGGDIMPVEVLLMEGKGNLTITGNIGDIMEESAQASLSYLKSCARKLKVKIDVFEKTDIHLHIPEGAVPKDGPSAGITIATAIISAFTGRMVRRDLGMTGEVTLRGRVLPVGGVREKVTAAYRAELRAVILPERNQKDLVDVPKTALANLKIIPVSDMAQVLDAALLPKKTTAKKIADPKQAAKKSQPPVQPGV